MAGSKNRRKTGQQEAWTLNRAQPLPAGCVLLPFCCPSGQDDTSAAGKLALALKSHTPVVQNLICVWLPPFPAVPSSAEWPTPPSSSQWQWEWVLRNATCIHLDWLTFVKLSQRSSAFILQLTPLGLTALSQNLAPSYGSSKQWWQ